MHENLQLGKKYLHKAIRKKALFPPPYTLLIYAEKAGGNQREIKKIHDRAIKLMPESFYIRDKYISAIQPRWGGSYEEMTRYIDSINFDHLSNARIWQLKGEVDGEKGYTAYLNRDYKEAIEHYTKALSYGDKANFFWVRGYSYLSIREYEDAHQDFSNYLKYVKDDKKIRDAVKYLNDKL